MDGKPKRGQTMELSVETLAFGGKGLAKPGGFVIFVPGAVPNDRVRVTVTKVKKRYAEARLEEILEPSPDRRSARCRHFGSCGGCRWQNVDYGVQLEYKSRLVRESLEHLGGLTEFELAPIAGMDDPWRYRNKVEFSIGADGPAVVGFHPPGRWDRVLPLAECHLVPETTEQIRRTVEEWLRANEVVPWDPVARRGFARHLTVREAQGTGEILVSLVTSPGDLPDSQGLVRALETAAPGIVGIIHAFNSGPAEVATGLPSTVLRGRDHLFEQLGHLRLKVSLDAFFQTNTQMAHRLYEIAAGEADLGPDDVLWDLYSGIGSITLFLAGGSAHGLGIEVVEGAVEDARENARLNGAQNITFMPGDARVVLKEILEGRTAVPPGAASPNVVVLDPPRSGLAKKVVARTAASAPDRIVYVSCNPSTMAPNVAQFHELGYALRRVTPVDMFPHTPHIEAVGLLERA